MTDMYNILELSSLHILSLLCPIKWCTDCELFFCQVKEIFVLIYLQEKVIEEKKEHVNVVFIGHVDAGKSTIGGQIMALTGMVDKRTLEKYEREAREKSRESWYLSWALDTNQEGKF